MNVIHRFKRSNHGGFTNVGQPGWRKFATMPVMVTLAVILIIAGILIGRSIHHHSLESKSKAKPTPAVSAKSGSQAQTSTGAKSSSDLQGTKSTGTSSSSTSVPLPNTGPGDTAAIFVAAVVIGGSLHYVWTREQKS